MKGTGRVLLLLILCLLAFQSTIRAQLLEALKSGVVRVKAGEKKGSGFIIRSDSYRHEVYILTAAHVVKNDSDIRVEFFSQKEKEFPCKVLKRTEDSENALDLAILVVQGDTTIFRELLVLSFPSEQLLHGGENVQVIGTPVDSRRPVWSVVNASVEAVQNGTVYFSGNIGDGHSGSPIILNGDVVGLVTREGIVKLAVPATGIAVDSIYAFLKGTLSTMDVLKEFESSEFCVSVKQLIVSSLHIGTKNIYVGDPIATDFEDLKGSLLMRRGDTTLYRLTFDFPGMGASGFVREMKTRRSEAEFALTAWMLSATSVDKIYHGLANALRSCLPNGSVINEYQGQPEVSWKWMFHATEGLSNWVDLKFGRNPGISIYYWEFDIPTVIVTFYAYANFDE